MHSLFQWWLCPCKNNMVLSIMFGWSRRSNGSFSSVAVSLWIEFDSKIAVDISNGSIHNIEFGIIIQHCGQVNRIAHELTHATPSNTSFQLFIDIPPCINDLLSNEIISTSSFQKIQMHLFYFSFFAKSLYHGVHFFYQQSHGVLWDSSSFSRCKLKSFFFLLTLMPKKNSSLTPFEN